MQGVREKYLTAKGVRIPKSLGTAALEIFQVTIFITVSVTKCMQLNVVIFNIKLCPSKCPYRGSIGLPYLQDNILTYYVSNVM